MKLTLIRHGKTQGNVRKWYYGSSDLPLLPEGVEELKKLATEGDYPIGQRYYTSPLIRTQETLRTIYGEVPFTTVDNFREMPFGIFERKTYEEIKDHPLFLEWCEKGWIDHKGPGGESWNMVRDRALAALAPIIEAGEDAVCVIHGGVIGRIMAWYFPEDKTLPVTPEPGHGYTLTIENGQVTEYNLVP